MASLPREEDTPFSLPRDVPEVMPVDHPALDAAGDPHEAYDEGLDDLVDVDPYRPDDDPIKANFEQMREGTAIPERYTTDHATIRRWAQYRYGHPAKVARTEEGLEKGGLYIRFEDDEPAIELTPISWKRFFDIFEKHNLAFVFWTKSPNGEISHFYRFADRDNVERLTEARRVP